MKRKDYRNAAITAGLKIFSWLKYLPFHSPDGKPIKLTNAVPIVIVPIKDQHNAPAGFVFKDSTLHYVTGCHVDHGYCLRAMVCLKPDTANA